MTNNASPSGEKRVIKFRFWYIPDGTMVDWLLVRQTAVNRGDIHLMYDVMGTDPDYIKMQFTGLVDYNGKEIYEGDILSFVTQRKHGFQEDGKLLYLPPVKFGRICVKDNSLYVFNAFHIDGDSIQYKLSHDAVVAGNIYEHPNLLTPQTPTNG